MLTERQAANQATRIYNAVYGKLIDRKEAISRLSLLEPYMSMAQLIRFKDFLDAK